MCLGEKAMLGRQEYQPKLFSTGNIEELIPQHHFLRKVDKVIELSFVRELAKDFYCPDNGRPSIDPELFFRRRETLRGLDMARVGAPRRNWS